MPHKCNGTFKTRVAYIDLLRIIAVFFVLFNHQDGFYLYENASPWKSFFYSMISALGKINVPLFMMISGALLLERAETLAVVFKKRIFRFVLLLSLFSLLTYGLLGSNHSITGFIRKLITGDIHYSYWYLYAHLGFLVMLPYLRRIARDFSKTDFIYFLAVYCFFCALIPIGNYILLRCDIAKVSYSSSFDIPIFLCSMVFYPLMGYYIDKKLDIRAIKPRQIWAVAAVSLLALLITAGLTVDEGFHLGFGKWTLGLFTFVYAISIFLLVKYLLAAKDILHAVPWVDSLLSHIGPLTLGMYLLDPIWKRFLMGKVVSRLDPFLPTILVSAGWCLFSMLLSGIVFWLLKRIPGLRKIL